VGDTEVAGRWLGVGSTQSSVCLHPTPFSDPALPPPPGVSDAIVRAQGVTALSHRTHWNRIFPVALFVEHVLLGVESQIPELQALVTEYVFLLNKVSAWAGLAEPAAPAGLLLGCRALRRHRTFICGALHPLPAESCIWKCRGA